MNRMTETSTKKSEVNDAADIAQVKQVLINSYRLLFRQSPLEGGHSA